MPGKSNQLERYGAFSRVVPEGVLAPGSKVFLVGDSDDTSVGQAPGELERDYPVDQDGVVRVYTTIQGAVNACAGGRGDVVLVLPNHVELLNRADSWNVGGVQVIGMGNGEQRSGINLDTTGSTVNLGAAGVRVSNLMFTARETAITRALDLDTGFFGQRVDNCIFTFDATGDNFITVIRVGSKEAVIEDNQIYGEDTTGHDYAIALLGGDADRALIRNNVIMGNFDSSVIGQDTADTLDTNLTGVVIANNSIVNFDTTSAMHIRFSAGFTARGLVYGNRIASYDTGSVVQAQDTAGGTAGVRFIDNRIRSDSGFDTLVGG